MIFRNYVLGLFMLLSGISLAQVRNGEWKDHLSYRYANSAARVGDYVYVSNGSGLARYKVDDNSMEKLTKIDGLSDIGVKLLRYNENNRTLMVIYNNANIDIIKDDKITNFSDIKRKVVTGNKVINEVYFKNQFAYLACGFGIILFDTDKMEIKDTYYIGPNGANLDVYQVSSNDTCVIAATETGVYYASIGSLLNNFQNWHTVPGLPNGPYNGVVKYNSMLLVNYSEKLKSGQGVKDTMYQFDGVSWSKFTQRIPPYETKRMYDYSKNNKLMVIDELGVLVIAPTLSVVTRVIIYNPGDTADILDAYYEDHLPNYNLFWVADKKRGLVRSMGSMPDPNEDLVLSGPISANTNDVANNFANSLAVKDGYLYVAPVYLNDDWSNSNVKTPLNAYKNQEWINYRYPIFDTIEDINCVAIDPNDKDHVAYGAWGQGLIEMRNNQVTQVYNTSNSPVSSAYNGQPVRIGGLAYDKNSNLWISSSHNNRFLNVLKKNGTWSVLDFTQFTSANPTAGKILVDKHDQVWMQLPRGAGMVVYKDGTTFAPPNSSNTRFLTVAKGSGGLPTVDVFSLAEDQEGHIWVGTAKGVAVFYSPENVFTGANWDCQQILIQQDGHTQILLETETVNAIAVDGANRKWIGTESSGLYCFSPDGQTQIYHFTVDNSPIYSNTVRDIVTDETTGDVFVATDKGIQSYRTPIIKGFDSYTNVHAYPNPARPGYGGHVYVTGLIDESIVKVTDAAGNLVWETKSEGGQIEWNLQTFSGVRASSGVYMIYCASSDGAQTAVTKLLVVNN